MKRLVLLAPLAIAVVLLSGCPDTKLPSPTPKVPEPKAQTTTLEAPPASMDLNRNPDRVPATRP